MKFKKQHWQQMCDRLRDAEATMLAVRNDERDRSALDEAVWQLWTFGEYAINTVLEISGDKPDQKHQQAKRAEGLYSTKVLQHDYSEIIDKLEHYRLKADYSGYSREPSTHYSPQNVSDCCEELKKLRTEVEGLLQTKGLLG